MRHILYSIIFIFSFSFSFAQSGKVKAKKYPSLLWEISGNGLKKPSYLFGTMHVSSKMAFHLSDSFYLAIRNADVVALETNPETWQKDFSKYDFETLYSGMGANNSSVPNDYITINTLKFTKYEKTIAKGLHSNPSVINNLLYRSNSDYESEFEEDTYLDMYIFQVGKKWGKKVCGVEDFDESMRLMIEAYADGSKDKNRKERRGDVDEEFSFAKLQDAYRTGNLDLLDTINVLNSLSPAFNEKFLYKRNEIQAASIDSILKSKATLFVGVGAAHLPGNRGVIEMLREKGYKLRPIKMLERDSRFKEEVEQLNVPVQLKTVTAADGFFSALIPGELYDNATGEDFNQQQYADMANGSYYMITRIQTNSYLWGASQKQVNRQIDSLLYENIPGKIISKKNITQNGYNGFDITNKTRRGDFQRYKIFVTPFEIILFKMSGTDEYVKNSVEAEKFFNSIQLKETGTDWKKFSPEYGGFEAEMPGNPLAVKKEGWLYAASDASENSFLIKRTDIHNYGFAEEDSFDLNLMEESFASSEFIHRTIDKKLTTHGGYPALDAVYKHKDSSVSKVKHIIQGPHYYTLIAHGKNNTQADRFLKSFSIKPFIYKEKRQEADKDLFFTVTAPVFPEKNKEIRAPLKAIIATMSIAEEDSLLDKEVYLERVFANDSTGEKVYVSYYKSPKYFFDDDTTKMGVYRSENDNWIVRNRKTYTTTDNSKVWEYALSDTNSSRVIYNKVLYKNGVGYALTALGDTLSAPSDFVAGIFNSFTPADSVSGADPAVKKTSIFFNEFFSKDTTLHKKAVANLHMVTFDSTDFSQLKKSIQSLTWKEKKYLDVKNDFIYKLSSLPTSEASDFLKELYYAAEDTMAFQNTVLVSLLQQQTKYSYNTFKDILLNEPPVLNIKTDSNDRSGGDDMFEYLYDSLQLTATIFKDMLPLLNLDDYEHPLMDLLGTMVDSNHISAKDYEIYLSKFLLEAKQAWKKQSITEKTKSIAKAQQTDEDEDEYRYRRNTTDPGNEMLSLYARLLIPFWDTHPNVQQLLKNLLSSNDKRLKYNTASLFLHYNKSLPDTLMKYFAATDDYKYELYLDLWNMNKLNLFPAEHFKKEELAKSKLLYMNNYDRPDTVAFVQKVPVSHNKRNGYVYFFKYKEDKKDATWRLASVGIVPEDNKTFIFNKYDDQYEFTDFSETKLNETDPVKDQLNKELKKLIYAKRKSSRAYYNEKNNWETYDDY